MALDTRRWFNHSLPQTLQIALWLLYFNGFYALLGLLSGSPVSLLMLAAFVGGGFGIANEQKWGYALGVVASLLNLLVLVWAAGGISDALSNGQYLIGLLFAGALVALLVHPQSRDYQKIWFE